MKVTSAKFEETVFEDIVTTLKKVPKARLGVVRDLVHALAVPQAKNGQHKVRTRGKDSLVDTHFCGMWADREDIADEQTFARQLRLRVEERGDRSKNVR